MGHDGTSSLPSLRKDTDTRTQASLDDIHVFDIASLDNTLDGVWYHQRASGRTPGPRLSTCAIDVLSPDRTNYHV
jgi:hypothetical protein